ncbi:hypothetical protein [Pyxidicoccus caerfyrddinensis]|uniref:hypothetical protein n=1 Tax=Pyxidicoccus caerfyrddinensis TaxID=2709663 RepID=UPI0013DB8EDA|nr:hypothetical protein [Pyxidicoccus caerfyrddinensis]
MKLKTLIGSLTLASLLVGGTSLAAAPYEPTPPHDSKPAPIKEAQMERVPLSAVLRDAAREDLEKDPEDGFLPELPILVDGVTYTAEQIREKDIHLSHYVLDGRSAELGAVQGFRTTEELTKYLEATNQFPSEEPKVQQLACDPYSWFFEHAGYWGYYFTLYPGYGYSYVGNFWNDRISSIWSTQCGSWTLVTEHSNYQGHVLWIGRNWAINNLSGWGWYTGWWPFRSWHSWNDRISSVAVYW